MNPEDAPPGEPAVVPAPRPARSVLLGLPPVGNRFPGAVRVALALAIPATIATLLGYGSASLLVGLGAFASIYGEGRPYRSRWKAVGIAALALTVLSFIGASVGEPIHRAISEGAPEALLILVILVMAVVVSTCAFTVDALRLGPPGAFFLLLTTEISSVIATPGQPPTEVALWTAVGGASALLVSMTGILWAPRAVEHAAVDAAVSAVDEYVAATDQANRHAAALRLQDAWQCLYRGKIVGTDHPLTRELERAQMRMARALADDHDPELMADAAFDIDEVGVYPPLPDPTIRYRFLRACNPSSRATITAIRLLLACIAAGSLTVLLGIDRPDWAVIAAAMVLHQGPDRILGTYRGIHRIGGTVLGLLVLGGVYLWSPTGLAMVAVLAVLQLGIELFLVRNYGVAVIFITPMAILLGAAGGAHGTVQHLVLSRMIETAVGVVVALIVLWTVGRRAHRRTLEWVDGRVARLLGVLLTDIRAAERAPSAELCRDLEFELRGAAMAGIDAAHNEPDWATQQWAAHTELHHLGSDVLHRLSFGTTVSRSHLENWERRYAACRSS
ncbi:FUSC family protein [Rhodococcus sp. MS16]|uniref:FUSC family protein n=1 Tax=Rhodococcus sp. MS16 TaxID=2579941 RepID=UPI0015629A1A|nr:FUSC family protein [Rhodococcus sp. MS16]